jgi:hypothetical protein
MVWTVRLSFRWSRYGTVEIADFCFSQGIFLPSRFLTEKEIACQSEMKRDDGDGKKHKRHGEQEEESERAAAAAESCMEVEDATGGH